MRTAIDVDGEFASLSIAHDAGQLQRYRKFGDCGSLDVLSMRHLDLLHVAEMQANVGCISSHLIILSRGFHFTTGYVEQPHADVSI
jgi:hypothetical protein